MRSLLLLTSLLLWSTASVAAEPPSGDDGQVRALLMDLAAHNVDDGTARTIASILAVELSRYHLLSVLTADDMKRSVEAEETRASVGCDTASCLAELAGALGAEIVIYGDVGRLSDDIVLNLSLFDTAKMASISRVSVQVSDSKLLSAALRTKLRELLTPFYAERGLPLPHSEGGSGTSAREGGAPSTASGAAPSLLPWLVVAGGVVGLVGGAALTFFGTLPAQDFFASDAQLTTLEDGFTNSDVAEAKQLYEAREQHRDGWQTWGLPLVIVGSSLITLGVVAIGGGGAWALLGDAE